MTDTTKPQPSDHHEQTTSAKDKPSDEIDTNKHPDLKDAEAGSDADSDDAAGDASSVR